MGLKPVLVIDLIAGMLHPNPAKRLRASDVLGFNWPTC